MDRDHAETYLREYDLNGDAKISLDEYLKGVYKISERELEQRNDEHAKEVLKSIKAEKARFKSADVNQDNYLSLDEFVVFLHPENYDSMALHELERIFSDFDRNNDGVVSLDEFVDISYRGASQSDEMKSQFDQLDLDKNNVLTPDELRIWLLPSLMPTAQNEAKRLINLTDTNNDGRLSKQEILQQKRIWSDSPTVVRSRALWDEL